MNIDDKITQMFEVVQLQKKEVETAEKESKQSWKTNGSFQIDGIAAPVNIQTASESAIKKIVVVVLQQRDYAKQAGNLLGLPHDDKINGIPITIGLLIVKNV
jgi:hypothetical protein